MASDTTLLLQDPLSGLLSEPEGVTWIRCLRGFRANNARAAHELLTAAEQKNLDHETKLWRDGAPAEK